MEIAYHSDFLLHKNPEGHPERKERLERTIDVFNEKNTWSLVEKADPELGSDEVLGYFHSKEYIEKIKELSKKGGGKLDPDTFLGEKSLKAARRAVGAGISLFKDLKGTEKNGFGLLRPPGHHAEKEKAMGFCLFNNIAILAEKAIREGKEVAIVDFDVHHGNGVQNAFYDKKEVFYFSIHQKPHYPQTGEIDEIGVGDGEGYNINLPLSSRKNDLDYLYVFDEILLPILEKINPDCLFVSGGFDAHLKDNYSEMELSNEAYEEMTKMLNELNKPVICLLEGGYNLDVLPMSILATLKGLGTSVSYKKMVGERELDLSKETIQKSNKIKQLTKKWFN